MSQPDSETLAEFRKSFSYGSRNDLLFKFLGSRTMSDQGAAEFFRGLLEQLGEAFDSGKYDTLLQYCVQSQVSGYTPDEDTLPTFQYDTTPWAPLAKPLSECRLALLSAGGLYVEGDDPLGPDGPSQEEAIPRIQEFLRGAPILSVIPRNVEPEKIRVRHPGYDIRGALKDYNVVFPLDRLRELEVEGVIGELAEENYSFVGASSQKRLLAGPAHEWSDLFKAKQLDAVMLVAA